MQKEKNNYDIWIYQIFYILLQLIHCKYFQKKKLKNISQKIHTLRIAFISFSPKVPKAHSKAHSETFRIFLVSRFFHLKEENIQENSLFTRGRFISESVEFYFIQEGFSSKRRLI